MKEVRYFYVPQAEAVDELPAEEATHAIRVLRMSPGDTMVLMDGEGTFYDAEVTLADHKHCRYRILQKNPQHKTWNRPLTLAIAPTKMMERMEWMVEKAVEMGIDDISFLECHFSERKVIKLPRIAKIVVSAMKQSRKPWMTRLHALCSFKRFLESRPSGHLYIAHCYEEVPRVSLFSELQRLPAGEPVTVMIGPEGDFSIDEVKEAVKCGCVSVHLGESRLRTETAGLMAVSMMQLASCR